MIVNLLFSKFGKKLNHFKDQTEKPNKNVAKYCTKHSHDNCRWSKSLKKIILIHIFSGLNLLKTQRFQNSV